ncbi:hypothetical protein J1614_010102 [Plenodomus biglobosus]|nr:hypothetical protein J1614_010102 [Plenodomus biglobosus]
MLIVKPGIDGGVQVESAAVRTLIDRVYFWSTASKNGWSDHQTTEVMRLCLPLEGQRRRGVEGPNLKTLMIGDGHLSGMSASQALIGQPSGH